MGTRDGTSNGRAACTVLVTAGNGEVSRPVTVKASDVLAGTTWPTRADVTADGLGQPENAEIGLRATKDLHPVGDGH